MAHVKRLISLTTIALALLLISPTGGNSQQEKPTQEQSETQKSPAPTAVLTGTATASQPAPTPQAPDTTSNPQSWDDWFWQNVITLSLAIVAIWGGCIALSTLDAIRDQARIARIALTRLERPWIVVGLKDAKLYLIDDLNDIFMASVFLSKRNEGRSLGRIVGGVVKAVVAIDPLPEIPDYTGGSGISFGQELIGPSQELEAPEQRIFDIDHNTWYAFQGGNAGKTHLAIYGRLEYRGVLEEDDSPLHETRFCLFLIPPTVEGDPERGKPVAVRAYYAGPAAYNRST